jgi:hypothetical protein
MMWITDNSGPAIAVFVCSLLTSSLYLVRKYVMPLLKVERNRRYAEWIAKIADEVTDDLVGRYPERDWARMLDELVDGVIRICGVSPETAKRAAGAAVGRRNARGADSSGGSR